MVNQLLACKAGLTKGCKHQAAPRGSLSMAAMFCKLPRQGKQPTNVHALSVVVASDQGTGDESGPGGVSVIAHQ